MNPEIMPQLYKVLFDNLHMGVLFINPKGIIVSANKAAEKILNLSHTDLMNKQAFNEIIDLVDENEKMIKMSESPMWISLQTHKSVGPFELGIRNKIDMKVTWLMTTTEPIFDEHQNIIYIYTTFEDITEKKAIEKNYQLLFNEMLDGYALHEMIYDHLNKPIDYRFLVVNKAFRDITGFNDQNIIGKSVLELLPNTEHYWIETYGNVVATGKPVWFEQYSGELGKTFEVKAFSPEEYKFAVIITDVSERKLLENQMKNEMFNAEQTLKTKGQFLANISHEIRTPMNSVLGVLSLLEFTKLDDEQLEYISIARNASKHLMDLIEDFLTLSKIESGKMVLDDKPFLMHEIVDRTWSLLANKARLKNIKFTKLLNMKSDVLFIGDQTKLSQILVNLLSNAVKFTSSGDVSLTIDQSMDVHSDVCALSIVVKDTGIGMSSTFKESLFSAYYQEHRENEQQGYGLGLVITKELVSLMGGTIYVESDLGVGSTFTVKIQLKIATS